MLNPEFPTPIWVASRRGINQHLGFPCQQTSHPERTHTHMCIYTQTLRSLSHPPNSTYTISRPIFHQTPYLPIAAQTEAADCLAFYSMTLCASFRCLCFMIFGICSTPWASPHPLHTSPSSLRAYSTRFRKPRLSKPNASKIHCVITKTEGAEFAECSFFTKQFTFRRRSASCVCRFGRRGGANYPPKTNGLIMFGGVVSSEKSFVRWWVVGMLAYVGSATIGVSKVKINFNRIENWWCGG